MHIIKCHLCGAFIKNEVVETAIAEARKQEREKCVEELEKHSAGLKPSAQQMYVDVALHYASHYLKKGLK